MADRQSEFAQLLQQHHARLYAYLYSLVRDFDDADDLFQQTTVVLWKKFDEFDRSRSFLSWACGIARFESANFLRSRSRQKLYFTDDLNLLLVEAQQEYSQDELEERRDALAKCVDKLRQRDRELLEACYCGAANVQQVADAQGRSTQSIHNSLRRIRKSLFECIRRTLATR